MPAFTRLKIQKPLVHKLTLDPSSSLPAIVYYEMRGAGGGSGGGVTSSSYKKGGDGRHGTKVYGQVVLNSGESLFLCPGEGGQRGEGNVTSFGGAGEGGRGVKVSVNTYTYRFGAGNGGNGSGTLSQPVAAGGGGGGASVIVAHKQSGRQIIAVAAGGAGGGGAGRSNPSLTSEFPYIGSISNRSLGGGEGQTHGGNQIFNYRYSSYLGQYGAGGGGGGGGTLGGLGGLIDFGDKPAAPGSSGSSFSSKILSEDAVELVTNQIDISPIGMLEQNLGGDNGVASEDAFSNGTSGDNGYIIIYMYPLNRIRLKDSNNAWITPDSFYYKTQQNKWSPVRKMFYKKGVGWNKFYDTDLKYNLTVDDSVYSYDGSLEPAIAKEQQPPPPPPSRPIVDFTPSVLSGEAPLYVYFTDQTTNSPTNWQWDINGDGVIDSANKNTFFTYPFPGVYNVTLTASNSGGSGTKVKQITVLPPAPAPQPPTPEPTPPQPPNVWDFNADKLSGVAPLTVQFTDISTTSPTVWEWNMGDGSAKKYSQHPSHTYDSAGTYTVSMKASNSTETRTVTKTAYITVTAATVSIPRLIADFEASTYSGVAPLTVNFTDKTTGDPVYWSWDFTGDGFADSTAQNPSWTFRTVGRHVVKLTADNATRSASSLLKTHTAEILVSAPGLAPIAKFSADTVRGVKPLTVNFKDLSENGPTAWLWDFIGDGSASSTSQNPTYEYTSSGKYDVTLTVSNAQGNDVEIKRQYIEVYDPPAAVVVNVIPAPTPLVASFSANVTSGTAPLTVNFTDHTTQSPNAWEWDFTGSGSVDSTAQNPSFTYLSAGTYTVTLKASNASGSTGTSTRTSYIKVSAPVELNPPVAKFTADTFSGEAPLTVQFTDLSTNSPTKWQWDFTGDGSVDSTTQSPSYTFQNVGSYSVSLTVENNDGFSFTSKTINATAKTEVTVLDNKYVDQKIFDRPFGGNLVIVITDDDEDKMPFGIVDEPLVIPDTDDPIEGEPHITADPNDDGMCPAPVGEVDESDPVTDEDAEAGAAMAALTNTNSSDNQAEESDAATQEDADMGAAMAALTNTNSSDNQATESDSSTPSQPTGSEADNSVSDTSPVNSSDVSTPSTADAADTSSSDTASDGAALGSGNSSDTSGLDSTSDSSDTV